MKLANFRNFGLSLNNSIAGFLNEIDAKAVAAVLIAPDHLGRGMTKMPLDEALWGPLA